MNLETFAQLSAIIFKLFGLATIIIFVGIICFHRKLTRYALLMSFPLLKINMFTSSMFLWISLGCYCILTHLLPVAYPIICEAICALLIIASMDEAEKAGMHLLKIYLKDSFTKQFHLN